MPSHPTQSRARCGELNAFCPEDSFRFIIAHCFGHSGFLPTSSSVLAASDDIVCNTSFIVRESLVKMLSAFAKRAYKTYRSEMNDAGDTSDEDSEDDDNAKQPGLTVYATTKAKESVDEAIRSFGMIAAEKWTESAHAVPGRPFQWSDGADTPEKLPSRGLWLKTFQRLFEVAFPFSSLLVSSNPDSTLAASGVPSLRDDDTLVHSETRQLLVEPEVLEVSASLLRDLLQNVWDDDRDALERTLGRMVCALKDSICLVIGRDITGTMEMFSGSTPRDRASIIRLLSTLYALWPLITTEAPTRTLYPKRIFCMLIGLATRVVETFDGTSVGGSARMPHEDSVVIFEKLLSAVAKLSSGSAPASKTLPCARPSGEGSRRRSGCFAAPATVTATAMATAATA